MKRFIVPLLLLAAVPCWAGTRDLKEDTAVTIVVGPFVDDTGAAVTAPTIASIDITAYKNDGTAVGITPAASGSSNDMVHVDDGYYSLEVTTTDTSTPGYLRLTFQISGSLIFHEDFNILPANIYDSLYSTDKLQVDAVQHLGTAYATPTVNGVPEIDVTHWNGTAVAGVDTAGYPKVTIKDGTGTGELDTASGLLVWNPAWDAEVQSEAQDAISASFSLAGGVVEANAVQFSGDPTAADNAELMFDGTGYAGGTTKLGVNIVSAAGTAWGSGAITAGSIATDAITDTKVATGALVMGTEISGALTAADIQTECEDALELYRLDELLAADSDIDGAALPTTGSVFFELLTKDTATFAFDQTTDSLEATRDALTVVDDLVDTEVAAISTTLGTPATTSVSADIAAIEAQTDDIGVAGAGLTAISGSGGIEYTPTGGQIWYVDGTNDGSGDTGSRAAPFDTVGAAVTACASGDAICIAAGTYTEQVIVPNEKTNLEIYGTGWGTIIQYATVSTGGNEYDPVMKVSDGCYVHDIKINSSGAGQGLVNIDYDDYIGETDTPKNYVRVERVWADAEWDGMYFTDCKHITIRDCRIIATYDAINVSGSNGIVERCYIKTNGAYGTGASSKLARGLVWTQSTAGVVLTVRDTDISVPCTTDNDAGYIAGINVSDLVVTPTQSLTLDNVNIRASSTHASATAGVYGIYQSPDSGGFQANPVAIRMIGGSIVTSSVAAVTVQDIAAAQDANNVTTLIGSRVDISKCVGNVQVIDDDVAATLVDTNTYLDATVSSRLAPTTSGRTLDVTATGAAGIDWANVEAPTTTVGLTGTTVDLVAGAVDATAAPNLDAAITTRASATVLGTPSGASIAADIAAVDAGASQVTADRVAKQVTFSVGSEGTESRNIVKLNAWSTGTRTLGFDFTELLKQMDTTLSTVDTVTVVQLDGSPSITTSSLRKHQNGMVALWNTAAITTANAGTYVVTVTVTTTDSNTVVVTGTLEVE